MALPGETECREIMTCGAGRWGDIPLDATTVYVDWSYDPILNRVEFLGGACTTLKQGLVTPVVVLGCAEIEG